MSKLKYVIPEEFYRTHLPKPYARNVGELIDELKKLPPSLPINIGFGEGCRLLVYNVDIDAFLEIVEDDDY